MTSTGLIITIASAFVIVVALMCFLAYNEWKINSIMNLTRLRPFKKRTARQTEAPEPLPARVHPDAWIESGFRSTRDSVPLILGPHREGDIENLVQAHVLHLNETLKAHGIHASKVDGGFEFVRLPATDRQEENQYNLLLEHVIQGLGIRYQVGNYPFVGLTYTTPQDGGEPVPTLYYDYNRRDGSWRYRSSYNQIFQPSRLSDFDTACTEFLKATSDNNAKENLPTTPEAIMGRLVINAAKSIRLNDDVVTGVLLPYKVSARKTGYGASTSVTEEHTPYIPQIYFEYLRSHLPISYLLAAFLSVHANPVGSRRSVSASPVEPAPRFNIVDVYGMREMPIGLVLEMVGATRAELIAGAR